MRKRRHKDPSCVRAPSVGLVIVVPHQRCLGDLKHVSHASPWPETGRDILT